MKMLKIISLLVMLAPATQAFSVENPVTDVEVESLLGTYSSGSLVFGSSLSIANPKKDEVEVKINASLFHRQTLTVKINDFKQQIKKTVVTTKTGTLETRYSFTLVTKAPYCDLKWGPAGFIGGQMSCSEKETVDVFVKFTGDEVSVKLSGSFNFAIINAKKTEGFLFEDANWEF